MDPLQYCIILRPLTVKALGHLVIADGQTENSNSVAFKNYQN